MLEDVYYLFKTGDLYVESISNRKVTFTTMEYSALKVSESNNNFKFIDRQDALNVVSKMRKHGFEVDVIRFEKYVENRISKVEFDCDGRSVEMNGTTYPRIELVKKDGVW